jgi:hypothetical protein
MADNFDITPGSGGKAATDDIGGVHFQRIKLIHGADGTNEGDVAPNHPLPVSVPNATSVVIMSVTTAATGTNFTAFSSQACNMIDINNTSSVAIEYRRNGAGNTMTILSGSSRLVNGISNASDISIRRVDTSNTQITISAEAYSL